MLFRSRSLEHMRRLLCGELSSFELEARESVKPGKAEGEIIGGCLSVVVAMLATSYAPDFKGKVLFLEDTGERAYRVDRMLVQLRQSGALRGVVAVVAEAIGAPGAGAASTAGWLVHDLALEQLGSPGRRPRWLPSS